MLRQLTSCQLMHNCTKMPSEKRLQQMTAMNVISIGTVQHATCHFLLVVCCSNVSILHYFHDTITYTVHVITSDFDMSSVSTIQLKL